MALLIFLFTSDVFCFLYYLKLNTVILNKNTVILNLIHIQATLNIWTENCLFIKITIQLKKDQVKINPVEVIVKHCIVFCKHCLYCHCSMILVFWAINDYSHNILIKCMAHINQV